MIYSIGKLTQGVNYITGLQF